MWRVVLWLPLIAVVGYYGLNIALQHRDSVPMISNIVSQHLPGAEVRFAAARFRVGWQQAIVRIENFHVVAGKNSLSVPQADFWIEPTGVVVALDRPTIVLVRGDGAQIIPPITSHWAVVGEQANIQWYDEENQLALTLTQAQLKLRHDNGLLRISAHEHGARQTELAARLHVSADDINGTVHLALNNWQPPAAGPWQWQDMQATAQMVGHGGQWRGAAAGVLKKVKHDAGEVEELHWYAATHFPPSITATLAAQITVAATALSLGYLPQMPRTQVRAGGVLHYAPTEHAWQWHEGVMLAHNDDGILQASLTVSGQMTDIGAAEIHGRLVAVSLSAFASYTPAGDLRDWFAEALLGGTIDQARFSWRGKPADFPFSDDGHDFALTAKFTAGELRIDEGWPLAQKLDGHLLMRGDDLDINGNGQIADISARARVYLPKMLAPRVSLYLLAAAEDETMANYTQAAKQFPPLRATVEEVFTHFSAQGHGPFQLSLSIPLAAPANTRGYGLLDVAEGQLQADDFPAITAVEGRVYFSPQGAHGQLFGMLTEQSATVDFYNRQVKIRSAMEAQTALDFFGVAQMSAFGVIPFELQRDERQTVILSSLSGLRLDYLAAINQDTDDQTKFKITVTAGMMWAQLRGETLYLLAPKPVGVAVTVASLPPSRGSLNYFSAAGYGHLRLSLRIPVDAPTDTRGYGLLHIAEGQVQVAQWPRVTAVMGDFHFADKNVAGQFIGRWDGQPMTVDFANTQMTIRSAIAASTALAFFDFDEAPVSGIIPFVWRQDEQQTVIVSSLRGLRLDYPAPLNKDAMADATLNLTMTADRVRARVQLHGNIWHLTTQEQGIDLAINAKPVSPPARGLRVHGTVVEADVDSWLSLGDATNAPVAVSLTLINVNFVGARQQTMILHSPFAVNNERQIVIAADSMQGTARLGEKYLDVDLARLSLSLSSSDILASDDTASAPWWQMTVSLAIQQLQMGNVALGFLQLIGTPNHSDSWRLQTLSMINDYATLAAEGEYFDGTTAISVRWQIPEASSFLQSFALSNVLSEGVAEVDGSLAWRGAPTDFSLVDLQGQLHLRAAALRYLKREEGVVGLLAIFSPQSLLSLGFVELGKEGTGIDDLRGDIILNNGKATVHNWEMKNDDFSISMEGDTDLAMRTLNIRGRVRPGNRFLKASSLVSIGVVGAAAVQPLTLAAYWLAGKVFEKPLSEIGAYNYTITGTWDSPVYKESGVTIRQPEKVDEDAKE